MSRYYVLSTADAEHWQDVLPAEVCVMGSVEYARIGEQQNGYVAKLFVVENGQAVIAYPFFLRPINELQFAGPGAEGSFDTYSPEYTGPIILSRGNDKELQQARFAEYFSIYCREVNIVCEFAHLNPWLDGKQLLNPKLINSDREVVTVDLTLSEEDLWKQSLTSDARRQTRQAEKAGVIVRRAESIDDVKEFHRLHENTMERRHALERYRIPLEYFVSIFQSMPEIAFFMLAEYQDRVVAGGLYLHGGSDVYWHLSAVDLDYSRTRPVNKYVWQTLCWATDVGKKRMLLGGGYNGSDGVFRFKAGFSPLREQFSTYRCIHNQSAYSALIDAWAEFYQTTPNQTEYFPAYRSIPQPELDE
jgi:hypothetical protein